MLGPEGTVVTKTLKIHAQGSNRKKQKYLREQTREKIKHKSMVAANGPKRPVWGCGI